MRDKEYRHGLINAQIEIDLPLEIRALRKQRGWTQPELAKRAEMKQPRISAMEKPGGANFNLETLKRLAEAFDVALIVQFAPFSELLDWSDRFTPDSFAVPSFGEESAELELPAKRSGSANVIDIGMEEWIRRQPARPTDLVAVNPSQDSIDTPKPFGPSVETRSQYELVYTGNV